MIDEFMQSIIQTNLPDSNNTRLWSLLGDSRLFILILLIEDFDAFNSNLNILLKMEEQQQQYAQKTEYAAPSEPAYVRTQQIPNSVSSSSLKRAADDHSDDEEHPYSTNMKTTDIFKQRQQKRHIKQN
jgi:hypothetical protein